MREWLVRRSLYFFFVCAFALITCTICYIIRYHAQMKVVVYCLDSENLVGSRKDHALWSIATN